VGVEQKNIAIETSHPVPPITLLISIEVSHGCLHCQYVCTDLAEIECLNDTAPCAFVTRGPCARAQRSLHDGETSREILPIRKTRAVSRMDHPFKNPAMNVFTSPYAGSPSYITNM
jgi:hypothetical protein